MKMIRTNLENEFLVDMILNNGFIIKKEDTFAEVDVDKLINTSQFTDCEYRCDCGAFIGQDLLGQTCPKCKSEIALHALNFMYTGWIDLGKHKVISPIYYIMLKRILGTNQLKFILGDYKEDVVIKYNPNGPDPVVQKPKRAGRPAQNDINFIKTKITKSRWGYQGLGHDEFYNRFEEVMRAFCKSADEEEMLMLIKEKDAVFTSKIPIYSTAFRPVSKTSETMFYPKINKWFAMICSIYCKLDDMVLEVERVSALNYIQNYLVEAVEHLIALEVSKKDGLIRSEVVGGTSNYSGRAVIILDISLKGDEVDLPLSMCITAFQYKITHLLATRFNMTLEQAYVFISRYPQDEHVLAILDEIIAQGQWITLLREPTNCLGSIELCKIRKYKIGDETVSVPPEPLTAWNADFDGDALISTFLPKELVKDYEAFHYSYMTDFVNEKFTIDFKEWIDIHIGILSD